MQFIEALYNKAYLICVDFMFYATDFPVSVYVCPFAFMIFR